MQDILTSVSVHIPRLQVECSMRCRRNLTAVNNVCEGAPNSVFWTPKGFNELPEVRFGFHFTFIGYCQSGDQSLHVLKVWYTEQGNVALLRRRYLPRLTYVRTAG